MILPSPPTILAPMAGYTHHYFRRFIRSLGGAGFVVGEFVSSEALTRNDPLSHRRMTLHPGESPVGIQIFGADPERMASAALQVQEAGATFIDINAGCPARRVMRSGGGAALLGDPGRLKEIIQRIRDVVTIPLTLKLRLGLEEGENAYLPIAQMAEREGVAAVTLHPRSARAAFRGKAAWEQIRRLKERIGIPVFGNGEIRMPEDALRMFEETGCDAVMVGRGALANPWIFRQISALLEGGKETIPPLKERLIQAADYYETLQTPHRQAIPLLIQMSYGEPGCRSLRARLHRVISLPDPPPLGHLIREELSTLPES